MSDDQEDAKAANFEPLNETKAQIQVQTQPKTKTKIGTRARTGTRTRTKVKNEEKDTLTATAAGTVAATATESFDEEFDETERELLDKKISSSDSEGEQSNLRTRRVDRKESKSTPKDKISERVLEARRDFDAAMEKIKSGGRRRLSSGFDEPIDLDQKASDFRRKMEKAAIVDNEAVESGQPALAKHKMLPEVVEMLNRYGIPCSSVPLNEFDRKGMHDVLLDAGILTAVKMWLEPLPNRSLPAISLRRSLLELIKMLPVETDHLRESQIGRIVLYFSRRQKEAPDVQRLAKELIARWSRPVVGDRVGMSVSGMDAREEESVQPVMLQSESFREGGGREMAGLTPQHKKLVMHMQKKAKGKKSII